MFKSLQATIFCFAAVILAIVLIASTCSEGRKKAEFNSQIETMEQQINTLTQEHDKTAKELAATQSEAKLLSDQIKAENDKSQKYQKKLESLAAANVLQKDQLESARKQIADSKRQINELQNKLLVARQLTSAAANPQEVKKLEAELKAVKEELANKNLQNKVLIGRLSPLADEIIKLRKKLEEVAPASSKQGPAKK